MEIGVLSIFFLVYIGMVFGSWPGLALDRTGIALLGAIAMIELQNLPLSQVVKHVDIPSITILFSFMVISAQFYYSGFYTFVVEKIEKWQVKPSLLLLTIVFVSGILSAVLLNDIVCLALAPLVIKFCYQKELNPLPFLLGLSCASNIGSALTLVGNPQNLLIGQVLAIPFSHYLKYSAIPCVFGLLLTWLTIKLQTKQNWYKKSEKKHFETIPFDFLQSCKGVVLVLILLIFFLAYDVPRDRISLFAAGFLLLSRRMASQTMLNFIDWQLLVLFIGLFIINNAVLNTHYPSFFINYLEKNLHINFNHPIPIFLISIILSNIVSNVPAVMLLLPFVHGNFMGSLLGLSSTLAGNICIIGSIANLIVVSQAAEHGIKISWKKHMRVGLPISCITLFFTAAWLYVFT